MKTLEISLKFRYDDNGIVTGWEMSSPVRGDGDVLLAAALDNWESLNQEWTIAERLIGALNKEFQLPPIPGMPR